MESRQRKGRATLKEIAQEAGVSICTASVVLNNSSSGSRISAKTRESVLEIASRLGYRANQIAQSLNAGRTRVIGIVPAAAETNIMLGPHLQHVLNGVANETEKQGYDISLITRCDQSNVASLIDVLMGGRLDGVIVVAPRTGSKLVSVLQREGLPLAVIDGDPEECAQIFMVDNASAVESAVRHLYDLGHRSIGHIAGDQRLYEGRARKDRFFEVTARLGMRVDLRWVQLGGFEFDGGRIGMKRILQGPTQPTAVFCGNDEMAFGALQAAQAMGLRVPEDISIVGFDDVPMASYATPALTTVRQPVDEIARAAAAALLAGIEHGTAVQGQTFPGELMQRRTTAEISAQMGIAE
ncbi:LacI family transcriptional regulator [bacterium]|nr:MAG: LacI family transcriptional regulator [bacterium]